MPAPASVRFLSLSMGDAAKGAQILVHQGEGRGARATKRGYFERGLLSVDPPRLSPPLSAAAAAAFLRASCVLTCGVGGKKEGIDGNDAWEAGEAEPATRRNIFFLTSSVLSYYEYSTELKPNCSFSVALIVWALCPIPK